MVRSVLSLALLLALSATACAADSNKGLQAAANEVLASAAEQQIESIVVIVRFDPTGIVEESRETIFVELRDELQLLLGTKLQVTLVKEAGRATSPFTPDDFSKLEGVDGQDAVLCVDYKRTARTRTAKLSLVNSEKVLFTRLTALETPDEAGISKLTTPAKPPRKTTRTAKNNNKSSSSATTAGGGSGSGGSSTQGSAVGGAMAMQYAVAKAQSAPEADPNKEPVYNKTILNFAVSQLGKVVGDGTQPALVIAALAEADARPGDEKTLEWGTPIGVQEILPGDIIQTEWKLNDASGRKEGVFYFANWGSRNWGGGTWGHRGKFTAIVYTWDWKQRKGIVLNQAFWGINFDPTVHTIGVDVNRARPDEFKAYRARRKVSSTDTTATVGELVGD